MSSRFKISLRRRQNYFEGNPVLVQCNSVTGYSEYVPGMVDNNWYNYTDYIEGQEKLSLTWDKVNSGNTSNSQTNQDGSNYDKGISSDLTFIGAAYQFIYDWLLKSECQILNAVEVKIEDLIAGGTYRIFEIKNDNIDWAPIDEPCQLHIKLREQDGNWHCIHKTFIWDNWQNWFDNTGTKSHPCFLTCIEPRPRLVQSVRMALAIFIHAAPPAAIIDALTDSSIQNAARRILNANRFVDAPLIRTYLNNVATKCGMLTDTIFDEGQPFENLCLYHPQAGFMHESNEEDVISPAQYFHYENRWLITIAELFDKLKPVFAAEWYVTPNNTIVFKHTKDLIQVAAIYDFTLSTSVPIYDLRYTFNGEKKPAYGRYEYTTDGSDLASQEIANLYNDIVDYDGPANNPMLEGERTKTNEFAPTGFIRDGRSHDYISLLIQDGTTGAKILLGIIAVIVLIVGASLPFTALAFILAGTIFGLWNANINGKNNDLEDQFINGDTYTGAVRLTSEQTLTPRLILWDGLYMQRAKAVATIALPEPNTYYNPSNTQYSVLNNISQDNPSLTVYNYPMYFDQNFTGNLFDQYHDEIDNPLKSKESHQDVKWNIDLCEDMLKVFGVFENQYITIGKVVKLEERDNYDVFVRLGNIQVDYDNNKINLKGKVLRRA